MWKKIKENEALKSRSMWAVWLVPTALVPTFRFMGDTKRPLKDRLKISVRDFSAYIVGTFLFFTLSPISQMGIEKLILKANKNVKLAPEVFKEKTKFATTVFGSVVSAVYSGFGAMPFANWLDKKMSKGSLPALAATSKHPQPQDTFINTATNKTPSSYFYAPAALPYYQTTQAPTVQKICKPPIYFTHSQPAPFHKYFSTLSQ